MKKLLAALSVAAALIAPAPAGAQFNEAAPGPVAIGVHPIGSLPQAPPQTVVHVERRGGGVINIGQAFKDDVAPYVDAAVNALILAVVGMAIAWFKRKTGLDVDQAHRDALVAVLQREAGSLIADGEVRMKGLKIDVGNAALAKAANDALRAVPDAARHFGLTPEGVATRIVDMIPQTPAGAQVVAAAHNGTATAA